MQAGCLLQAIDIFAISHVMLCMVIQRARLRACIGAELGECTPGVLFLELDLHISKIHHAMMDVILIICKSAAGCA